MARVFLVLFFCATLQAQKAEYDFYREGRDKRPEAYAEELRQAGVSEEEIARRLDLLRNHRPLLEADRWNRFYGDSKSNYNKEPNAFLAQVAGTLKPGVALDYAMGDGRNALYLARLGWTVHGFDMSEVAVAAAKRRAAELGLKIDALDRVEVRLARGIDHPGTKPGGSQEWLAPRYTLRMPSRTPVLAAWRMGPM